MRKISAKRIVVKIGTSLVTKADGRLKIVYLKNIVKQIVKLRKDGKDVILVSSGAIGAGVGELCLNGNVRDVQMRQVCAAVGQAALMEQYKKLFGKQKVAQVLISYGTFLNRKSYLNLMHALHKLLQLGIVPIINENDVTSVEEIDLSFGDNDRLSSLLAGKIEADLLIMLTNVDGLYDKNPKKNKDFTVIPIVKKLTADMKKEAGKASLMGKGGMRSKIKAAEIAMDAGITMIIANGNERDILSRLIKGEELGTLFVPGEKIANRKRWIMHSPSKGHIEVDEGAKKAVLKGKNLLPAGIKAIEGSFDVMSVVEICCDKKCFAKALVDYSSDDLEKIKGKHSDDIQKILGHGNYDNITRRENLIIL